MEIENQLLVDLLGLSKQLGLSKRWLQREAVAGRIPSLKAGGRRVFSVDAVRRCLAERASPVTEAGISSILEDSDYSEDPVQQRWLTAIHEAGHAVVAHAFGRPADRVALWASGGGIACIGTLGSHVIPEAIAAGPIAQKLFAKEPKPASEAVDLETLDDSWAKLGPHGEIDLSKPSYPRSDEQKLRIWAMSHCARNPELWAKRLIDTDRDALRELKVNKTSVMNLARALYIRGELKGRDAVEAMYWPGGIEPETHTRLANPTHEPINNTEASR